MYALAKRQAVHRNLKTNEKFNRNAALNASKSNMVLKIANFHFLLLQKCAKIFDWRTCNT